MRAPNQERFAASSEIPYGLLANLVTRRCEVLQSAEEIELIFFLQYLSWQTGGLKKVAKELIERFRDRIATESMLKFGYNEKKSYSLSEAKAIYAEVPFDAYGTPWELLCDEPCAGEKLLDAISGQPRNLRKLLSRAESFPAKYCKEECETFAAKQLPTFLEELCLDPKQKIEGGPWYFPTLVTSLFEWKNELAAQEQKTFVATELGELVHETLNYSLHGACLTLLDGRARTGKTFAAKKWVAMRPGKARFVEIPVGNSDVGFFRAIGEALGLSMKLNHTLRDRIETVLRTKNIMLVLDEGHAAWPDTQNREALPFRVSWIMSMVNAGVPISLIVTNQFFHAQKRTERRSGWTSEQFVGRIAFYQPLPEALSDADLSAVAQALLPEGCSKSISLLVLNAKASAKYLAGIEFTVKRARYLASKAGREKVQVSDLKQAISDGVIPSDKALSIALAKPEKTNRPNRVEFQAPQIPEPRNVAPIPETKISHRGMQPVESV